MDKNTIQSSITNLDKWLIKNEFKGYDPFDGLSTYLRIVTFRKNLPQRILQQSVRRIPINLRPVLGIKPHRSTKGMSFLGSGYLKLYELTNEHYYRTQAMFCFDWLMENYSKGYSGYCWGNSFDYISRAFYLPKGSPTLVWTSLIGHHFIEAYRTLHEKKYLEVIESIGEFIVHDIPRIETDKGICLSYVTFAKEAIHNANLLGARMLSEIYSETKKNVYKDLAIQALKYSMNCQMKDGSWYYGEAAKYHWIDNWHTAYNLDSILGVLNELNLNDYHDQLNKGLEFYIKNFFTVNGAPKYYPDHDYKYDIQSASQAIDTLTLFNGYYNGYNLIDLASKVAKWTLENMQNPEGYFYLWKNKIFTNRTPTFHWGCTTMFRALANLLYTMNGRDNNAN